jgi:hypothetical protein
VLRSRVGPGGVRFLPRSSKLGSVLHGWNCTELLVGKSLPTLLLYNQPAWIRITLIKQRMKPRMIPAESPVASRWASHLPPIRTSH